MKPGRLDRRVTLLRRVTTGTGGLNDPTFEWQAVRTFWAARIHKSEDEVFAAAQRYAKRTVTFRCRFMADVTEVDRLEEGGITYSITGVRELGRREGLDISAEWTE